MKYYSVIQDESMFVNELSVQSPRKPGYSSHPEPSEQERAVPETKQPKPTNTPVRKTDPSGIPFGDEEE
jgi:hypothetical protein